MIKKKIFNIIQIGSKNDAASYIFDIFIVIVILLNLFVTFFSTFDQSKDRTEILVANSCQNVADQSIYDDNVLPW